MSAIHEEIGLFPPLQIEGQAPTSARTLIRVLHSLRQR